MVLIFNSYTVITDFYIFGYQYVKIYLLYGLYYIYLDFTISFNIYAGFKFTHKLIEMQIETLLIENLKDSLG